MNTDKVYTPETSTVPDQIKRDLTDLSAYCDLGVTGFDRDILMNKVKILKMEVDEYISFYERD